MTENTDSDQILLVEDNPGDVRLIREAFRDAEFHAVIHTAIDGVEAIEFLTDEESPCPDLVLLDLNLPRKDGFDVLEEIRNDPELQRVPVLVLTSSTAREDVVSSYEEQANAYLTKPNNPEEFMELAQAVEEFWIDHVRLPPCP
ncbi:response regulator [Halopiger aswanensis]|uniref:Response regulator receiver domain-containing protein n=1 Tax=Halopiger aswanensis TaxID=148449 RepID=A0A3R7KI76_9EURY|nr:response regulator [Halopiger aswanensis]RKD85238.1 response regulator receiver domain-containing protein [Halopiger aswanensis]